MLADGFFANVERMAALLRKRLDGRRRQVIPRCSHKSRGKGLLSGLHCVVPNTEVVDRLRQGGLLTVGAGENVVRLLPPLIIDESHVDEAVGVIEGVARQWTQ